MDAWRLPEVPVARRLGGSRCRTRDSRTSRGAYLTHAPSAANDPGCVPAPVRMTNAAARRGRRRHVVDLAGRAATRPGPIACRTPRSSELGRGPGGDRVPHTHRGQLLPPQRGWRVPPRGRRLLRYPTRRCLGCGDRSWYASRCGQTGTGPFLTIRGWRMVGESPDPVTSTERRFGRHRHAAMRLPCVADQGSHDVARRRPVRAAASVVALRIRPWAGSPRSAGRRGPPRRTRPGSCPWCRSSAPG